MQVNLRNGIDDHFVLERTLVRRSFDAASESYDAAAVLQAEVRTRLHSRLDYVRLAPAVAIDLGTGTGHGARALKQRYRAARILAIDLAPGMLRVARRHRGFLRRFDLACADAARLPVRTGSVDLVVSNLMLQWCDPPDAVFAEVARVLRPGGLFTFTTFGPDTLRELRAAWRAADADTHVNRFIDMHDLGDALVRARFAEPVMDVERFTLTYDHARDLMRDLKAIGAHNVNRGRAPGLTGKRKLLAMQSAYESFRTESKLPATYEVVYGQAWGSEATGRGFPDEVSVPVARIGRRGQGRRDSGSE